jgi:hypothetical protein
MRATPGKFPQKQNRKSGKKPSGVKKR